MLNILKEIEEKERKNRELKELEKKKKDELNKRKEEQRQRRLEREKENKLKEEQFIKEKKEEKIRLQKKEQLEKENKKKEQIKRLTLDNKRLEELYLNFRKLNNILENNWNKEDIDNKKKYINELAIKQEEELKKMKIEEERRKKLKKNILKNQYDLRNKKETNYSEIFEIRKKQDIEKQIKTIEDMCILGDIMKKEIIKEKKENSEKFIKTEEAINNKDKNESFFVLGLLAKNLESYGITTAIEKEEPKFEENDESGTSLQFLINGLGTQKKYDFHFDISEQRNEELLNNKDEQEKFINNFKKKLSKAYNIPEDEIIITNPQRGSFQLSVIFVFQSKDFELNINDFKEKFKNEKELIQLKTIHQESLLSACKLNKKILDSAGNNCDGGWGIGEIRGGEEYIPPIGWIGYGLNVFDKYDLEKNEKRNDWISYDNREGEWCIAYHGVGNLLSSKKVQTAVRGIATSTLKEKSQLKKEETEGKEDEETEGKEDEEKEEEEDDYSEIMDMRHPNNKVGKGVYCSPNPEVMDNYAGIIEINKVKYKMGFMLRVNPEKIRVPQGKEEFWVLNGNIDEVRPYRILVKKIE